jgi:hypothetical protein
MFQVDGIDIMAIRNFGAKFSKRCCKILVVLLSHDFHLVDGMVNFFIKVVANPILS